MIVTLIDCVEERGARSEEPLELCPELVRTLRRELSQMDARIGALQRSRGALAAYLR